MTWVGVGVSRGNDGDDEHPFGGQSQGYHAPGDSLGSGRGGGLRCRRGPMSRRQCWRRRDSTPSAGGHSHRKEEAQEQLQPRHLLPSPGLSEEPSKSIIHETLLQGNDNISSLQGSAAGERFLFAH